MVFSVSDAELIEQHVCGVNSGGASRNGECFAWLWHAAALAAGGKD